MRNEEGDKMNPNCLTCDLALRRSYSDGGQDVVCSIDCKPMNRNLIDLFECNKYRESGKDGKGKKEKAP
jgi:hypothetical protein